MFNAYFVWLLVFLCWWRRMGGLVGSFVLFGSLWFGVVLGW